MNDNILKKIKKCLALSKSSNQHEAQAALRQAQKMMQQYGITSEELTASETTEQRIKVRANKKPPEWQMALARVIDHVFGTKTMFLGTSNEKGKPVGYMLMLGAETSVQLGKYAYEVLSRQIERDKRNYFASLPINIPPSIKRKMTDMYCLGYTFEMREKVQSIAPAQRNDESIKEYVKQQYSNAQQQESAYKRNKNLSAAESHALISGVEQGKKAQLHSGMSATERTAIAA